MAHLRPREGVGGFEEAGLHGDVVLRLLRTSAARSGEAGLEQMTEAVPHTLKPCRRAGAGLHAEAVQARRGRSPHSLAGVVVAAGSRPLLSCPTVVKALVWFWIIDETLVLTSMLSV